MQGYKVDNKRFAQRIREKRGSRPLRDVSAELDISISVLSRVENAKMPDFHNFGILCRWLGDHPGDYFIIDDSANDSMSVQLRAAKQMSRETVDGIAELIRAAYVQALTNSAQDDGL